jgi:succinoglycan biosynthesis transport protein ExoP
MQPTSASPHSESRLHFLDYWRVIRARWVIVFAIFLLVVLVAGVVTFLQPKIYRSITRIRVEQEHTVIPVLSDTRNNAPTYDPYFLETQKKIIRSQRILHPVITRLSLIKRWTESGDKLPQQTIEFAYYKLLNAVDVDRDRDTSLILISVRDRDPRLAADIANAIAESFEQDRLEVAREQTVKGIEKLRDEMQQQQERLRLAQEKVETLRKEFNVPIFAGQTKLSDQTLQQLEQQLTLARVEAVTREARIQELKKLTPLQLRNSIATLINVPDVQTLLQNLTDSELKLEVLKEEYGPDHPNVRSALSARDKLNEQLDARLEGIMRGFEVEAAMADARVKEIQQQLDDAKAKALALESERYLPFRNAVREEDLENKLYEALKINLQSESIKLQVPRSPVELIDRAEPVFIPVEPRWWRNMLIAVIAGLLLGIGSTFFIEFLDTSVKKVEDVEHYLNLPVLGVVAQQSGLLTAGDASPGQIEAYRMLRTNIEFSKGNGATKSIAFLSPGAGEGKSFTIANLAVVNAQHGARVLVVDSDLRRPGVHQYLGVSNDVGLADYLAGTKTIDEIIRPTPTPNVFIIASGSASRTALPMLTSQRMQELVQEASRRFDVVLYDTPPVLGVSDAGIVAREVGTAVLVIQHRRYPRAMSQRAKQMIENAGGKLLGVVVNNVNLGQDETYYYYHDHYERYLNDQKEPAKPPTAGRKESQGDQIELPGKY